MTNPLLNRLEEQKLREGDPAAGILAGFRAATEGLHEAIAEARKPVTDDELRRSMQALVQGASVHFRVLGLEAIRRNVLLILALLVGTLVVGVGAGWLLRGSSETGVLIRERADWCQGDVCWIPVKKP